MKETPSYEIFEEMLNIATSIWNTYDNTYGYVTEKLNIINNLENYSDNAMIMYRMFDSNNQFEFRAKSSLKVLEYIKLNK
jgi:hypothetical protein